MNFTEKILNSHPLSCKDNGLFGVLEEELCTYGCKITKDALGSLFFTKKIGQGQSFMLCTGCDVPGVVATYVENSKVYVGELGKADVQKLAHTKVVFDGISGLLSVPDSYSNSTSLNDCYVETFDEKASEKISLGDKGYFDMPLYSLSESIYSGYGIGVKACVLALANMGKKLFDKECEKRLLDKGIGSVTLAFLGQTSLVSRGAFVAARGINPDKILLLTAAEASKLSPCADKDVKYAVKMLDKAFVSDGTFVGEICSYFDEQNIKYHKAVNADTDPALKALSRAESTPACAEICLPVFGAGAVVI